MTLFVTLGVVPTLIVLAHGLARNLPGAARREAASLGQLLGLDVSLETAGYPWPGVVVYHGLEIRDPASKQALLKCDRLEMRRGSSRSGDGANDAGLLLVASHGTVEASAIDWLDGLLHQVSRKPDSTRTDVRLTAKQLTLRGKSGSWTLSDVQAGLENGSEQTSLVVGFVPPEESARVHFRLARGRQVETPVEELGLDATGCSVPCGLIGSVVENVSDLGAEASFQGQLRARKTLQGWNGQLSGRFENVDLETLLANRFGHHLTGTSALTIQSAQLQAGTIVEATGSVSAGPGTIGQPLLATASRWLAMTPGRSLPVGEAPLPFEHLALEFCLSPEGLQLRGTCPGPDSSVAVSGPSGPLLATPARHRVPALALAAALSLPGDFQLPTTFRTAWLTGVLPQAESQTSDPPASR